MTRDELIARIEAGEAGHALDVAIARIAHPDGVHVPSYTNNIAAAVALCECRRWTVNSEGLATVTADSWEVFISEVKGNPAAAIVAAWLKATA